MRTNITVTIGEVESKILYRLHMTENHLAKLTGDSYLSAITPAGLEIRLLPGKGVPEEFQEMGIDFYARVGGDIEAIRRSGPIPMKTERYLWGYVKLDVE